MVINKKNKGGGFSVSPLTATLLLVGVAVIAIMGIFVWLRAVDIEQAQKFGVPLPEKCNEVLFSATLSSNNVILKNEGTVPIYGITLEISKDGKEVKRFLKSKEGGVDAAGEESLPAIVEDLSGKIESVVVVPVILGKTSDEIGRLYTCTNQGQALI